MNDAFRAGARVIAAAALLAPCAFAMACGDDEGGAGGGAGGDAATTATSSATSTSNGVSSQTGSAATTTVAAAASTGTGGPIGPGDGDFRTAFSKDGFGTTCDASLEELVAADAPRVEVDGVTLVIGFWQVGGNNQDPVLFRFDDGALTYCVRHEDDPPDARGHGLAWDGGPVAYVIYSVTGGGTDFDGHAQGGWIQSYGDGGGSSKVTVVAAVDVAAGTITDATFVPAKRENGTKTNTLAPAGAPRVLEDGTVEVVGYSAYAPLNPDRSGMCLDDEYPGAFDGAEGPSYLARFTADFTAVTCASTAGCTNVLSPCE